MVEVTIVPSKRVLPRAVSGVGVLRVSVDAGAGAMRAPLPTSSDCCRRRETAHPRMRPVASYPCGTMRRWEDADDITVCGASGGEAGMVTLLTLLMMVLALVEGGVVLLVVVLGMALCWLLSM